MGHDEEPLFAGYEPAEPLPDPLADLSADRRRTMRQSALIANGVHPLTKGPIHTLASRHRDADSPKADPFTCGSCWFRSVEKYHDRSYPKCTLPGTVRAYRHQPDGSWKWETVEGYPRISNSAASDVRAWWPACPDYSPGDRISGDAARSIPDAHTTT